MGELRIICEAGPGGFEAGIEDSNGRNCGYWGATREAALLSMFRFRAEQTRNLAEGVARDCRQLDAIADTIAAEVGVELNGNLPRTVYEATGEFGGGGELDAQRTQAAMYRRRLLEHVGVPVVCEHGDRELILPEEEPSYCMCGGVQKFANPKEPEHAE